MNSTRTTDLGWVTHNTILRGVVGSTVHGTSIASSSDRDEMAICIEPKEYLVGFKTFEQLIQRDKPDGVRSEPGDLDLTTYGLRKWCRLALKGNPSILLLLFVPGPYLIERTPIGKELQELFWAFASRQAIEPYLGFIRQQRERLAGDRHGHIPVRPELVAKYGYDTKYAGHILRLGFQGVEYLTTGRLTLPMPEASRQCVLSVRRGEWPIEKVLTLAGELEKDIEDLRTTAPLPETPNTELVESWMVETYEKTWTHRKP